MSELVAITGGAGFIGSHLAEGFLRAGYAVRVVDNLSTGSIDNLVRIRATTDFRNLDIRDAEGLRDAFRDAAIVLHHAAFSSVPRSFDDVRYTHEVNVTGTLNVFSAALRAGVRKMVYASSSSVYGNNGADLQIEGGTPSPLSPYALSKWMGELYAAHFAKNSALETVSVRYFNVFGPRQSLLSDYASVIPLFIRQFAEGSSPTVFGDGTQTRDFTYIENVVEAILRAAQRTIPSGSVLNIATGKSISINELVQALNNIFGSQKEPIYGPERQGDIKHSRASVEISSQLLGDYNLTDFRDGLVKIVRWFLETAGRTQQCE
jgi:nucleoside-diphosphate-sugar epimerase